MLVPLLLLALATASAQAEDDATAATDHRAECAMWAKLENKTLPLQNQGHANCTTNPECTGFECLGMYKVRQEIIFGIKETTTRWKI